MKKFAVLGHPIAHSKSPQIHRYFAEQTGISLHYEKILVPKDMGFAATMTAFQQQGGNGANITSPCKEDAFNWVTTLTARAQLAGAVNTIVLNADGTSLGDNTDGIGLIKDMHTFRNWLLRDKRILILGAGGATRGILHPLLLEQPALITIANRTQSRAESLAQTFQRFGTVVGIGFELCAQQQFDIIINALPKTSILPQLPISLTDIRCYDLTYSDDTTPFLEYARTAGATQIADGVGMLIEQAAESFYVWHGIRPNALEIRTMLSTLLEESHHGQ